METVNNSRHVSVIIPNYNHARFLKERIESVLNQSYQNFEVIILDDCSTDNSKEIITKYRNHPKVKHIVINEVNSGSTFSQWHKGFSLAMGDYIWIAESDDVAHPDFLSKAMSAINNAKDVVLAATGIITINENGEQYGGYSISHSKRPRLYSGTEFIRSNMLLGNHIYNASSVVFRKDSLYKIPKDYTNLRASGDYLFWIEIARTGNVIELPDQLDYFRRSSTTVTSRLYASGQAFKEALIIFNTLKDYGFAKGIKKHVIIGFRLWQIKRITAFNSPNIKKDLLTLWKNQSNTPILDICMCYIYGAIKKFKRLFRL